MGEVCFWLVFREICAKSAHGDAAVILWRGLPPASSRSRERGVGRARAVFESSRNENKSVLTAPGRKRTGLFSNVGRPRSIRSALPMHTRIGALTSYHFRAVYNNA